MGKKKSTMLSLQWYEQAGRGEKRGRALHARWTDEGRVSRRQINHRTSKENGLREGRNERVPPVCPMPFPLRSAWACSQISGPLCCTGAWRGLGHNAHNKTYPHTLTNVWKHGLQSKKCLSLHLILLSLVPTVCLWGFSLVCLFAFSPSAQSDAKTLTAVAHCGNTFCMLSSVWTLPSALACGSGRRRSLIMPCYIGPPLCFIAQPVSWLKVDSNLCLSFGLPVGTDSFLCPRRLWRCSWLCLQRYRTSCLHQLQTWIFLFFSLFVLFSLNMQMQFSDSHLTVQPVLAYSAL